jgi:hypothetical protein
MLELYELRKIKFNTQSHFAKDNLSRLQSLLEEKAAKARRKNEYEVYNYCKFYEHPVEFWKRSDTPCAEAYVKMTDAKKKSRKVS